MNGFLRSKLVLSLAALIMIATAIAIPLSGSITRMHAQGTITINEFPIPTSNSNPNGITAGPDGNLWFTETGGNQIGKMTPTGTFTEYPVSTSNSGLTSITAGSDGNLWFTEGSANQIGRITTSGVITEFPIPTPNSSPNDITAGPDGNVWFTEYFGNQIGRITPSGVITEFPLPTSGSYPNLITVGPDGNLWFTEYGTNEIGRITAGGTVTGEFAIPTSNSLPRGITTGPDGNLWFTEEGGNKIGRMTPSGTVTGEFTVPTSGSRPWVIKAGSDGNLWFTEFFSVNIGRITPSGTITEFPLPNGGAPDGITEGPLNSMWFTQWSGNKIGQAIPPSATLWGVDSFSPITSSFYSSVQKAFGTPDFWGRYIGLGAYADDLKASEVTFAHNNGLAILPVYSDYNPANVKGYTTGQTYATTAITAAQRILNISQGVAIFVDIEGGETPDSAFLQGWYDRLNSTFAYTYKGIQYTYQAGYYKAGYYGNTRSTNPFTHAYCKAVSAEPQIGTNSFIWSPQPNPGRTTKAAAPPFAPIQPPCANQTFAWQYGLAGSQPPNVDTDEIGGSLPLWHP